MLTRRNVILSGAAAGAVPFVPGLSTPLFAATSSGSQASATSAPVVFSPALAHYVASSGAVITKKIANEGLSKPALKGAASLVRIAANHTHQNQMDAVVQALLTKQPSIAQGKNIQSALTQAFEVYQQFHQDATMPDLSKIGSMSSAQSARALAYVSRVGLTGSLRDMVNVLARTAHEKKSLGLKQAGFPMHDGAVLGDGLWHSGQSVHLQHVCSLSKAKQVICSRPAEGADAGIGCCGRGAVSRVLVGRDDDDPLFSQDGLASRAVGRRGVGHYPGQRGTNAGMAATHGGGLRRVSYGSSDRLDAEVSAKRRAGAAF